MSLHVLYTMFLAFGMDCGRFPWLFVRKTYVALIFLVVFDVVRNLGP